MATTQRKVTFQEKLCQLQQLMFDAPWEKDKKNKAQGYRYISEAMYKYHFAQCLKKVGLLWKFDIEDHQFVQSITDKQHLTIIRCVGQIIDPETGESIELKAFGTGADMGDKGLYKAATGALKYILSTNFLVAENDDPEGDDAETKEKDAPKYTAPEKREEIKQDMLREGKPATKTQVNTLTKLLEKLLAHDPSSEDVIKTILEGTDNLNNITKEQAEEYIVEIGNILDGEDGE